jgi:hypothetical protein
MDLQCLCPYFQGMVGPSGQCIMRSGQPLGMAVRREIRTLSDGERQRLFQAIRQLKVCCGQIGHCFDAIANDFTKAH